MTVTLQDSGVILGIQIDSNPLIGRAHVGEGYRWETWTDCCDDLLEQHPILGFVYKNTTDNSESSIFHMGQNTINSCMPHQTQFDVGPSAPPIAQDQKHDESVDDDDGAHMHALHRR
ncbi:hypothetical protein AXF42_Ash009276 [Apostasia shenzhenica]|uniref:Uncharacterized protein n=1 Tax=Apostasia shenzhenica TaxID=1088818 RepID=A0A2I0B3M6_9ASPA|nr:hypothetical protein AXF42_Ash009276 [Apostasia shenzhenica]